MPKIFSRAKPSKSPLKRFYLICEGANTEPQYFEELVAFYRATSIELITVPGAGDPSAIAKEASKVSRGRSRKYSFEKGDEVWAIFDCDTHKHYEDAKRNCEANGVNVAYSDPCFELWLILHYQFYDRSDDHHAVQRFFENIDESYATSGTKICNFSAIAKNVLDAEKFAERLLKFRKDEGRPWGRPSTTVHLLTAKLRGKQ